MPGSIRRSNQVFIESSLETCYWVYRAGQRPPGVSAVPAGLIAPDARTHAFWMPRPRFPDNVRIGNMRASHVHHVGNTVAQYGFNLVQGPEPTDNDARYFRRRRSQFGSTWQLIAHWLVHGCHELELIVVGPAHVDEVDQPVGFQYLNHLRQFSVTNSALCSTRSYADAYRVIIANGLAYRLQNLTQKPHAIFQRTAILVGTMIHQGGEKLHHEIAVCSVNFHTVDAALLAAPCGRRKRLDDFVNLGLTHGIGDDTGDRVGDGGNAPRRHPVGQGIHMPRVYKLLENAHAVGLDGCHQALITLNGRVIPVGETEHGTSMHSRRLEDRQTNSAFRPSHVVVNQAVGHGAEIGKSRRMGRAGHPVGYDAATNLQRLIDKFQSHVRFPTFSQPLISHVYDHLSHICSPE